MRLGDLIAVLGAEQLSTDLLVDDGALVSDVAIRDPPHPVDREQLVLAVGVDADGPVAEQAVVEAARAGAAAIVFRASEQASPVDIARSHSISILRAEPEVSWTRLVTLIRTLITATAAGPPSAEGALSLNTVYDLADAIAVTVGGSVVLYDRTHRVVAFSVQGYEIDDVRRDTILGRRTPDQWVERFVADKSAYETFRRPGTVIRVDGYRGLSTRLRVAVCSDGEVLGEISVAEDAQPLGGEAEAALLGAARLAVPHMLKHRLVEDSDRATEARLVRSLLYGDGSVVTELGLANKSGFAVIGFAAEQTPSGDGSSLLRERILRLISFQMSGIEPAARVLSTEAIYYALVPGDQDAFSRLSDRIERSLHQLERMGTTAHAAIGPWAPDLAAVPVARQVVDDMLHIVRRSPWPSSPTIVSQQSAWPELALLPVERALAKSPPAAHLGQLIEHDVRHGSNYVETLRIYLDEFGSVSRTSERLMLHPNTVRHRLERLAAISGLDLVDPVQRLAIMVQLRVLAIEAQG